MKIYYILIDKFLFVLTYDTYIYYYIDIHTHIYISLIHPLDLCKIILIEELNERKKEENNKNKIYIFKLAIS